MIATGVDRVLVCSIVRSLVRSFVRAFVHSFARSLASVSFVKIRSVSCSSEVSVIRLYTHLSVLCCTVAVLSPLFCFNFCCLQFFFNFFAFWILLSMSFLSISFPIICTAKAKPIKLTSKRRPCYLRCSYQLSLKTRFHTRAKQIDRICIAKYRLVVTSVLLLMH